MCGSSVVVDLPLPNKHLLRKLKRVPQRQGSLGIGQALCRAITAHQGIRDGLWRGLLLHGAF